MTLKSGRLRREKKTVEAMLRRYCRDHHKAPRKALCADCLELSQYAHARLDKCPFGREKPACSQCHIHCYKADMRERIRRVMRYSGPKMVSSHPVLAIDHLIKLWRNKSKQ